MNHPDDDCYFEQWVGGWAVYPFYCERWNLRYIVVRKPGEDEAVIPVMPHPFQLADAPRR